MSDEPTYADLIEEEETLRREERERRDQHDRRMAALNKRIIAAMQREGIE